MTSNALGTMQEIRRLGHSAPGRRWAFGHPRLRLRFGYSSPESGPNPRRRRARLARNFLVHTRPALPPPLRLSRRCITPRDRSAGSRPVKCGTESTGRTANPAACGSDRRRPRGNQRGTAPNRLIWQSLQSVCPGAVVAPRGVVFAQREPEARGWANRKGTPSGTLINWIRCTCAES